MSVNNLAAAERLEIRLSVGIGVRQRDQPDALFGLVGKLGDRFTQPPPDDADIHFAIRGSESIARGVPATRADG